jgi:ribosomal protein S18 acetylase RimI-like enzyme
MRKDLASIAAEESAPPTGFAWASFDPVRHPEPARALLNAAYQNGGGPHLEWEGWWRDLETDPEYDPALCFIAVDTASGALAAFAQCWSSGFVKDIAVAKAHRRAGLGRALMQRIFQTFKARSCPHVDLKVEADNPSGAVSFYKGLGMQAIEDH